MNIEEVYDEAAKFTDTKFKDLNPNNRRITILATMKNIIEIKRLEQSIRQMENLPNAMKTLIDSMKPKE
uniref:Uncharacterized protein n=1 Tax=viral metagenome TaxID=1070528 RepID=A0A6M3J4R1_9ZZZZ